MLFSDVHSNQSASTTARNNVKIGGNEPENAISEPSRLSIHAKSKRPETEGATAIGASPAPTSTSFNHWFLPETL